MNSATNHLLVITGKPRTGKSRELIALVEETSASPDNQVAFLFANKSPIASLPNKCLLAQCPLDKCPIQAFMDVAGEDIKHFTHIYIDDLAVQYMPSLLRFAQSFPTIAIAVAMH